MKKPKWNIFYKEKRCKHTVLYESTLKKLLKMMKTGESYRDKLDEIVDDYYKKWKRK